MDKIYVVYWTGTGNTLEMANAIGEGVKKAGKEAEVVNVSDITVDQVKGATKLALGCPSMGVEVLEEGEMEPWVAEFESAAAGKTLALFGSYGWGDGEWMRDWVDRMNGAGASVLNGEGLICQEAPDDAAKAECVALGEQLAYA
ncbi:flavodoxin [Eubacterium oxidoreducens]|uniref:Flavodoxin n=1 Tax=Eubacterium oxidoreducens TaxID=1732 RepID=A0A1G6C1R9_EUBOX|nr:flavodoxin [Eubacterium oxidoreducens]SDB26795.1 flavodoxin, short chain [Eubacterium oxidoreducens]